MVIAIKGWGAGEEKGEDRLRKEEHAWANAGHDQARGRSKGEKQNLSKKRSDSKLPLPSKVHPF